LLYESKYIDPVVYIDFLINKIDNECKNLFIHSDDNLEVLKFKKIIEDKKLDYNIYYITDNNDNGGATVMRHLKTNNTIKSVDEMNNDEIKLHTEKMLCAIEIIKNSKNVILDYQSNVSRFIKLYKKNNVYNVLNNEPNINSGGYILCSSIYSI
jgi:hypothetical protein